MYDKHILLKSLVEASTLVMKASNEEISFSNFMKAYDNFYYVYALDGHEANDLEKEILEDFSKEIEFHRKIQEEVLNLIYDESVGAKEQYLAAGRIGNEEASKRLNEVCVKSSLEEIIRNLESQYRSLNP